MTDDEREKLYEAGRITLAEMLPKARAEAAKALEVVGGTFAAATSVKGSFALAALTEDCIESVMIYEDGPGRWYADIGLKPRFPDQPEMLGTPSDDPLGSRAEAEQTANGLLTVLLAEAIRQEREMAAKVKKDMADSRQFDFGLVTMAVPQRLIDDVLESLSRIPDRDRVAILERTEKDLEDTIIKMAGNEVLTQEAIEQSDPEMMQLLGILTAVLLSQDKDSYTPGVGQRRM